MITLTARINLLDSQHGTINNVLSSISGNNVSADINSVKGTKTIGSKPWIIGATAIGEQNTLESSVLYYMGSVVANSNKTFETPYTITINGTDITAFEILFDNVNNQFPTSIVVDGKTILNDDTNFTVNVDTANAHTVVINNWNAVGYPLRIQGIYIDIEIKLDSNSILSIDRTMFDRSDIKLPSWGIIANSGNIEFIDLGGEIKDYIEQQLLKSDLSVYFEIRNTLVENKVEQVGKFATDKWTYDNNNRVVGVSLKDDLIEWQDILINTITYTGQKTMLEVYNILKNLTPAKWVFKTLDNTTQSMLQSIVCENTYLEGGSLWNEWQKLCEVCSLYIYKNNNANVVVSSEFGD